MRRMGVLTLDSRFGVVWRRECDVDVDMVLMFRWHASDCRICGAPSGGEAPSAETRDVYEC